MNKIDYCIYYYMNYYIKNNKIKVKDGSGPLCKFNEYTYKSLCGLLVCTDSFSPVF